MYDIRLRDSWPACGNNWPPDLGDVTHYLRVLSYDTTTNNSVPT